MKNQKTRLRLGSYGRLGILLAVIGVILAVDTMMDISFIYKLWPIIVTVLGVGFIGIYVSRGRRESLYIGTGIYLIGFSGLALYCSLTSWSTLADLWPVFVGIMGISLLFAYFLGSRRSAVLLGGMLFISAALGFFFIFSLSHRLWWSAFIFAGVSFLIFDKARQS